jgi:uncharacterized integral membrane protein
MEGQAGGEANGGREGHPTPAGTIAAESRRERLARHSRRTKLYVSAFGLVALIVCLVALILANTRKVKLSWVFGDTQASLVWIILVSAILGWLLGLVIAGLFRRRTRRVLDRN